MDHHRAGNKDHKLAQEIKEKTIAILQNECPDLHMRFHMYVDYPPENNKALVYFNTVHAMDKFNLKARSEDENAKFKAELYLYSSHLYGTLQQVIKQLGDS